jgi:putative oxidoreductase
MNKPTSLQLSLFLTRLSVFYVMFFWTLKKFIDPAMTAKIWDKFYMIGDLSSNLSVIIGIAQMALIVAFVLGLFKKWTYGAVLILHGVSTISTWNYLIDPYIVEPRAMLFMAAVPMLAGCITLFLMRDDDNYLTFSKS